MSIACLFPGQGSQRVGMLCEMAEAHSSVGNTFAEASELLGEDLWQLAQEGPPEVLNQTRNAQLTLLATEISVWRLYCAQGGARPDYVAGHSFGEYAALVAAEALTFSDAVHLVRQRGELMQQAAAECDGGMAAILKLEASRVIEICAQVASDTLVEAVNFNAPGQVVISGLKDGVAKACELCQEEGGRSIMLEVTVPAHSKVMRAVDEVFTQALQEIEFHSPQIPLVNNVDVRVETGPQQLREALRRQLHSAVRWEEGILTMIKHGVDRFLEMGPGKVLSGLNRRIDREAVSLCIENPQTLQQALEEQSDA